MKKKGIMLILAVMLIMTNLVSVSLADATSTGNSDLSVAEVTKVSGVLNDLLSSELKIVKTGKSEDYSSVINENKLLQLIQKDEKYKEDFYNDISFKIDNYNSNVKINNVTKLSDKKYMLDVNFQADLILSKDLQIHPTTSENYVCEIENRSGQWLINKLIAKADYQDIVNNANDNDADMLANNDKILDVKLKDVEKRSANIDESVKGYKEMMKQTKNTLLNGSEKATPSYAGTNRLAVANYAVQYAMNHNYAQYQDVTEDCTNFVSQAVHAGGVPTDSTWNANVYPYTTAWVNVEAFYSYMINNGYARSSSISNNVSGMGGISIGDVIQWRYSYSPLYSHSTIATSQSDTYGWLLSAHNKDRCNYPISMYWASYSYGRDMYFW